MARRYTNTSQFNPYTFQELWQPAQAATQAHIQQATAYADLASKAAVLGDFINPEQDPEEYAAWNAYTQNLQQGSEGLMQNGLSTDTFNKLWQSSVAYARDIKPIETAVENKQKFAQMLSQTSLQHPEMLFVKGVEDYRLGEYRNGVPQIESIDMNAVQKEAATIAAVYANDKVRFGNPQQFDRFRQIITEKYGDTFEEALANMNDPNQILYAIKQRVMDSCGAERLLDNGKTGAYARLENAVDNGLLMGAVGKTTKQLDDTYFKDSLSAARFAYERQKDAVAMVAQESAMLNSMVWESAPGTNSRRRYGWIASSHGKEAQTYQDAIYGRLMTAKNYKNNGEVGKKFKVYDMSGKEVSIKELKPSDKARVSDFAITFEGIKNNGEYNLERSPYFLMKWNGKMYRVSADALGLDNANIENIEYIFGNTTPPVNDERYASRMLVDSYRRNPNKFTSENEVLSQQLQGFINDITISAAKSLYTLAQPYTTKYKLED